MSIYGAMNSAISGIAAQSIAFSNISDNVANSQTVGFKRVDTSFTDYLSTSTAEVNDSGTVVARPDYKNTVQGTISQSDDALAMAITGQGFFTVSHPSGTDANGRMVFAPQSYFSRAGDFNLNKSGYFSNGSGEYLNGWLVDANGVLDKSKVAPIQIAQTVYKPVATQKLAMGANLPVGLIGTVQTSDGTATGTITHMFDSSGNEVPAIQPQVQIYDSQGKAHMLQFDWTPELGAAAGTYFNTTPNQWTLTARLDPNTAGAASLGQVRVAFADDGTLLSLAAVTGSSGTATDPAASVLTNPGDDATVTMDTGILLAGGTDQKLTISLGGMGRTNGVTQFSATSFTLRGLTQDGVPPGSFSGIATRDNGDIYANYDNGQTRLIARVPIATFGDANALERHNGSSYTVTRESGDPSLQDAGSNGAGGLVTQSVESSNVDIASEFSKLIVVQRAYSANTKVVTTADELMQQTIDMKR